MTGADPATAGEIRDSIDRLRGAAAVLRRRHPREVLDVLGLVLEGFGNRSTPSRVRLEADLPAAAGFSAEVVREGLDLALGGWDRRALCQLADAELGPPGGALVTGFETTSVFLGGALPTPTLVSLVAPLALRSAVLAKTSQHDPLTARVFARALAAADPDLADALAVISFAGSDNACVDAMLAADCVVATGSDETIASLAARAQPPTRFIGYGHRVSVAALGPHALSGSALEDAARGIALDVSLWDQLGCLSPVSVFVAGDPRPAADAIAESLEALAQRLPRGVVSRDAQVAFVHSRDEAQLRAAAGHDVRVLTGSGWAVVQEADARQRPAPLHRFLRVHPVADEAALCEALRLLGAHLAGAALAGFGGATRPLATALANLGASRVCPPGRLQAPPLAWHHDGQGVLLPLARFTDVEVV